MGFAKKLLNTALFVGGTLGALALFNKLVESMAGELNTMLVGEEHRYPWKYGDLFYEMKGPADAKPLLLVHGFGPGASSYEWRKNVDVLAEQFRVYALDLLGFGLSDRPAIAYSAETFTDLLNDFIREAIGKPTIVIVHGLACAYAIASAFRRPQLFERLMLVSPPSTILQETFPTPLNSIWQFILRLPIVGQFIYNVLTSRQAIRRYYDEQGYQDLTLLTDDLVEYVYTSAHQPESRYAIAAFLSDHLVLDVSEPFMLLKIPVIAVWGREDKRAAEALSAFKRINPAIDMRIFDKSRFHLQDEQAAAFNDLVREIAGAKVG